MIFYAIYSIIIAITKKRDGAVIVLFFTMLLIIAALNDVLIELHILHVGAEYRALAIGAAHL